MIRNQKFLTILINLILIFYMVHYCYGLWGLKLVNVHILPLWRNSDWLAASRILESQPLKNTVSRLTIISAKAWLHLSRPLSKQILESIDSQDVTFSKAQIFSGSVATSLRRVSASLEADRPRLQQALDAFFDGLAPNEHFLIVERPEFAVDAVRIVARYQHVLENLQSGLDYDDAELKETEQYDEMIRRIDEEREQRAKEYQWLIERLWGGMKQGLRWLLTDRS